MRKLSSFELKPGMEQLNKLEAKKRLLSSAEAQSLLKDEIVSLQRELESQTVVRSALQKALNCRRLPLDDPSYKSLSQPTEDLVKEIALLELEIVCLEKYLLSLYRTSFGKRLSALPRAETEAQTPSWKSVDVSMTSLESVNMEPAIRPRDYHSGSAPPPKCNDFLGADPLIDTGIYRSHSSLSHSACSFRASPPYGAVAEALDAYHSLPLSMLEQSTADEDLAEDHGCSFPETPNWISEEMIKCISTIYCHLSDPPLSSQGFGSFSLSSPPTKFSHHGVAVACEENPSLGSWLHVDAAKDFSGSIFTMVQVCSIVRDPQRLSSVQDLLQKYRSIISKLAQVDPGKLNHEQKLAFWINVHNALVMHAFMVYGTPRGSLKRTSLVLKAAYDVGGHTVSIDTIQSSILRCRLPRPTQWLHSLFFPKTKFKAGDPRKAYAVKHPEPRLHFALCSGCHSDPAVRLYTSKRVFQELEIAKEEYIQMNIKLHKDQRLLVPKNVEYFTKEMGLSPSGTTEMLEHSMPISWRKTFQQGKLWKKVDWIPHNFAFRFQISNELIR